MKLPILISPKESIGIRNYADNLSRNFHQLGYNINVFQKPGRSIRCLHFHLGNSTRKLWKYLLRVQHPAVVTLHDVVPRNRQLRYLISSSQAWILNRHLVVVHSKHSMEMLTSLGFRGDGRIIKHGVDQKRYLRRELHSIRSKISPYGQKILITAGILKKEKGIVEIINAAGKFPQWRFLFVGRIVGSELKSLLKMYSPNNVVHIDPPNNENFCKYIAASDLLLNFRKESVGEVSGPVVQAHALGVPVAGYAQGFMSEYCNHYYDALFPLNISVEKALDISKKIIQKERRIPIDSSFIFTWETSSNQYLKIYKEIGWI